MRDPWKYVAFPAASISGYLLSLGIESVALGQRLGVPDAAANLAVIGLAGLLAGFLVDEVIPAYIEKRRGGSGDFGGDLDSGDIDFGE